MLAHRDARDWYVFEAASWALAERRMPAERRRELWLEPLPAAELAGRLRGLPLFASVSVDELFRIAGASRQVRHQPGTTLLLEGIVPETIHILLDGRVTAHDASAAGSRALHDRVARGARLRAGAAGTPDAPVDADDGERRHAGASPPTSCARCSRTTPTWCGDCSRRSPSASMPATVSNLQSTGAARELEQLAAEGLLPIEKVLALQRVPVFSRIPSTRCGRSPTSRRPSR